MHENELKITQNRVHELLKDQCPQWASLQLEPVDSTGTDHTLFKLGTDYIVRLPRIDWAVESIHKEYEWVPKIAEFLKIPLSVPVFKGKPNNSYPWHWTMSKWVMGSNPHFEKLNEYRNLAVDLACFLNELHALRLPNGPLSRRGKALKEQNSETIDSLRKLPPDIDTTIVTSLWNELVTTPPWHKQPVWIHGDLLPGNVLIQDDRLSGVIDFSDVGIGDPAADLIIAWSLFNPSSRRIFREKLDNCDDDTWKRGKGWALSIALNMLPYYQYSNPSVASLARGIIKNVQADS